MQVLRCVRKPLDTKWVDAEVQRILSVFVRLSPRKVYLFGSAGEGRMTDQSDFDFLLIFDSEASIRDARKKLRPFYPLSEFPVDTLWMTFAEFERKKEIGGVCFIVHREGRLLYQREDTE